MIYAELASHTDYTALSPVLAKVLNDLASGSLANLPAGKHVIVPEKAWYSLEETVTRSPLATPFEVHREFADVHVALTGHELIGFQSPGRLQASDKYDTARDIQFFNGSGDVLLDTTGGRFVVFFPGEAHQPCLSGDAPSPLRKIVAKIHRSLLNL